MITTDQIKAEKANRHHLDFISYLWQRRDPFIIGQHTIAVCKAIDKAIIDYSNGISSFLAIKVPFRHGKSDMVSRYLPANFIGKFPDQEIIISAYTASLARTFSRFSRNLMRDPRYSNIYPGVQLSTDEQSIDTWGIHEELGKTHWLGLGGSVTGKGGSLIIIDDFFKNREEAESEVIRDKVWESITNDVLTRRAPTCIVIILATPWHVDDPFGRIQEAMQKDEHFPQFKELVFPAFSEDYEQGILFPERFNQGWYETQKATLGSYGTAALLQCDPQFKSGNLFKVDKIKIIEETPKNIPLARGWDLASSEKQKLKDDPDYTVGAKTGLHEVPSNIPDCPTRIVYLDDISRGQWEAPKRDKIIQDTAIADGCINVGVEAYGPYKDAYTTIKNTLLGIRTVKKIQLPGDKMTKISMLEPIVEAGNFYMRKAPWNEEVINEMKAFPSGKHDDILDGIVVSVATHTPYEHKIFPMMESPYTIKLELKWEPKLSKDYMHHYGAMVQEKDLSLWFLEVLYNSLEDKLYIYGCWHSDDPSPMIVVPAIINRMHLRQFMIKRLLVSQSIFDKKPQTREPYYYFRQEFKKRNCHPKLSPCLMYDQSGSITIATEKFNLKAIFIDNSAQEAARQLSSWIIEGGKPSTEDCAYCEGLMMIISELRRTQVLAKPFKIRDYPR